MEKIGHNPSYPVSSNWPHLVEEVKAFAQPLVAAHTGPVVLVGHSLGGMLSLMLAAQYHAYFWVVAGTTLGMMLANAPVVWLGERMTRLVPLRVVHVVSALIFLALGLAALLGWA